MKASSSNQQALRAYLQQVCTEQADCLQRKDIYLFGTGSAAVLYQSALRHEGIAPLGYIDNNPRKQGGTFAGKPVLALEDVPDDALVLGCIQNRSSRAEIERQISTRGGYLYFDTYLWAKNIEQVEEVLSLLADEASRETYAGVMLKRMKNEAVTQFEPNQYFAPAPFAGVRLGEVFVDCGAFVGDSAEKYLWEREGCVEKIFAIEPFAPNYQAMLARFERLRREWALTEDQLVAVHGAIGAQDGTRCIDSPNANLSAALQEEGEAVRMYTLDNLFAQQRVGFIKADIEGSEYDMLLGAEQVLKRDRPLLARCLYHTPSDFFRVPLFLHRMHLGYKFQVRQHAPNYTETILYAY